MNEKMVLAQNELLKKSTAWLLFIFLGWSYGSMGKMGLQILFYLSALTVVGFVLWYFIRLFTLNGAIKNYNRQICLRYGLTAEEMLQLGV